MQDELTKDSVRMYLTGNILFEKAFQAFENDHTISVLQSLQSQIPQTRKICKYLDYLLWNYIIFPLLSISIDSHIIIIIIIINFEG